MITKRTFGTAAAIGGMAAVVALLTGVPSAQADELSDLRANNQLLQQKLDQLAQTNNVGPTRPYSTDEAKSNVGGSFPRSFLIPGTDTSIRVGGAIREVFDYFLEGGNPNSTPQTTTLGATGQTTAIPLTGPASARGSNIFSQSPRESKLSVETRTPTALGEARTYMEFDWAGSTSYAPGSTPTQVSDNLVPRLRFAYGTLGGWLVGQANSNFSDADANGETIDFGGNVGEPGVVRIPQIRYTMPLAWAYGGALSVSAETPETDAMTPDGLVSSDCGVGCAAVATGPGVEAEMPNPTKAGLPDLTAALYIPQPWGHFDISGVLRPDLELSDGAYLSRTFVGYGAHIGFDVKPGWFSPKDDIIFHVVGGNGIGRYLNTTSSFALETNFKATTTSPTSAAAVLANTTTEFGGEVGYQHWWESNLRSNINFGYFHNDISSTVIGASAASSANKELETGHLNLLWNPVSFVTVGIEYTYGHREIVAATPGEKSSGNLQVIDSKFEVDF